MTTILRITLLSGRYGATPWGRSEDDGQVDYPPAPSRLLWALWSAGMALDTGEPRQPEDLRELLALLAQHPPTYHLPYGAYQRHKGSGQAHKELGPGAALHVAWPVGLSAQQERLLSACLAGLTHLGGVEYPAIWQVVPSMPAANCRPDPNGTLNILCCLSSEAIDSLLALPQLERQVALTAPPGHGWVPYRFEPHGRLACAGPTRPHQANRALFSFLSPTPFPAGAGIAWTDRLHRALLQRAPTSALFAGQIGGQPLPEDQRAWYGWVAEDDHLSLLDVHSPLSFSDDEIDALCGLQCLYGRAGVRVPLRLILLDAAPIATHRQLRTATPMLLYTTPRPGKIHRTPAAQAIQSLLWGMGEQGKLPAGAFHLQDQQECVGIDHPVHGRITARVVDVIDHLPVSGRGERMAASSAGFHLHLEADQPIPALGVGWGRHFGAGRLEVVRE